VTHQRFIHALPIGIELPLVHNFTANEDNIGRAVGALDLCERFGVKTTTSRTGKFCLVAAALFGDPDVDLQYHCMKAISQKPAQK
jgi:hypothetical protein